VTRYILDEGDSPPSKSVPSCERLGKLSELPFAPYSRYDLLAWLLTCGSPFLPVDAD